MGLSDREVSQSLYLRAHLKKILYKMHNAEEQGIE